MVATPLAVAGALATRRLPAPVVRGATEGARDAVASAGQFAAGWRALARNDDPDLAPTPRCGRRSPYRSVIFGNFGKLIPEYS